MALTFLNSEAYAADFFRDYRDGRADFGANLNYFKSTANFNSDGTKSDLISGTYFQSIDTTLSTRYVLIKDLGLSTTLNVGSSESADTLATRRNSSANKISIGSDYQIFNTGFWNLILDLSYSHALEKVDATADTVLNNDGANEVQAGLSTTLNFDGFVPFGQVGAIYRTEGLSTLLTYTGGAELRFDEIKLGGLLNGYSTLKQDENTARPFVRDLLTNRVDAVSKKYDAVNPTLLDSQIYLSYNFDPDFSIKTFGGYTLIGSNDAVGLHFGAAMTIGFGGERYVKRNQIRNNSLQKSPPKNSLSLDPNEKSFKEDTNDGVNQDYFKPVNPSKDQYIEQIEGSPKSLKNATEPDPVVPTAAETALQKDYKIKIKKKKKLAP